MRRRSEGENPQSRPMAVLITVKPLYIGQHARSTKSPAEAGQTAACRETLEEGRPRFSGRRLRLYFSRLSRAAADQSQVRRFAAQCRIRLLQYAVEASARHEAGGQADPPRGGVRPVRAHVPHRDVSGIQGAPPGSARRFTAAISADPRGGARLRYSVPGAEGFRGRRPDRDLCAAGLRGRRHRHHRLLGQGFDAARQRLHRPVRHHEGQEDRPRRGDREIRRAAGKGHRGAGADRRFDRQRAGRAGHRREDRRAAHRRIRRSRNAAQARIRDQAGEAPPDPDRERRKGAAVEEARHARRSRQARRADRRSRRARARLQAADRIFAGDGVFLADAAGGGVRLDRSERHRAGCEACRGCRTRLSP